MYKTIAFSALAALCLAACGGKKDDKAGGTGSPNDKAEKTVDKAPTSPSPGGPVTLNASGSTFQKPYQEAAIEDFTKANAGVKINYGGGGSGKGRQDLADMVVDFAGADSPYKDEDKAKIKGGDVLYFPVLLGAITISYNLDGVDKLQLAPATVAKIFQRDIKKWNDKEIAADNPDAKLPDADIVVAHRSDGSGTTDNFTKFLNAAAKDA